MRTWLARFAHVFDALQARWEGVREQHAVGTLIVAAFLAALGVIELNRLGLLGGWLARAVPTNHFHAVDLAFTLLLLTEVIALVFSLAQSVSHSVGMQFEIFSLILLRQTFKEFTAFDEPVVWAQVEGSILRMASDTGGALLIFVALGVYYRLQRHQPITTADDRASFVATKKTLSLVLLGVFFFIGATDTWQLATTGRSFPFFEAFYTVLIFTDVLLVLVSLRYSSTYRVVFRNSGFAAATVFMRLALTAPPYLNAALGLGAVLLACGLTLAYNNFGAGTHAPSPA